MELVAPTYVGSTDAINDNPSVFAEEMRKFDVVSPISDTRKQVHDRIDELMQMSDEERAALYSMHLSRIISLLSDHDSSLIDPRASLLESMLLALVNFIADPIDTLYRDLIERIHAIFPGGHGAVVVERLEEIFINGGRAYLIGMAELAKGQQAQA